jgi:hypothetical protein
MIVCCVWMIRLIAWFLKAMLEKNPGYILRLIADISGYTDFKNMPFNGKFPCLGGQNQSQRLNGISNFCFVKWQICSNIRENSGRNVINIIQFGLFFQYPIEWRYIIVT